ncbi:MAG TPA: molybdopterin-guanine dinucleotide biosynthesis protein B [Alphaproteobacteria bacterium]|nr:molybdopterin-guanine dinucleotide biosynthesis protein B [Alphaproteobacteria bacterium]
MMHGSAALFGLAGWSGSGKTTLAEQLITELTAQGLNMATIKHAHHEFDADTPGKDSWRHRKAGAAQVLVSSAIRSAHFVEHQAEEPGLEQLLRRLQPCDLVLIEGFKREAVPKLEIFRKSVGKPHLWPDDSQIIAVASDDLLPDCPLPVLNLNDIPAIAAFVREATGLKGR